jgi:hypothetical protein
MSQKLICTSSALALIFLATGAMADLTPEEVWENWQALSTSMGQELTVGGTARNGDTLEVTGVALTFKDDLGGSFSASFDKLAFKDNGDGTVAMTMSDSYPMTLAFPDDGPEGPSSMKLTVTQPGMVITAAGTPAETSYDFKAPSIAVKLDEIIGGSGEKLDTQVNFVMSEMTSTYKVVREGDKTQLDSSVAAKGMVLNVSGQGVDGAGSGTVNMSLTDLTGHSKGNFLGADVMANMATALNNGFAADTAFNFGSLTLAADITDVSGPMKVSVVAGGGGFVLAIDKTKVNYGTSVKDFVVNMSGPAIPFPEVAFVFKEGAFNVLLPVSKSDKPQDFAYLTKIVDFTMSEDVWGMFDPAASFSREPATFILDAKGTGFWKHDIMDPSIDFASKEPPGELNSLDLTQFLAKAAGAEVSAVGGLTFDNADLVTFGGLPRPDGLISVNIKGVTKLVDNLIAMGIVTEEDAMGFRMMLAMLAKPGAGPDELVTELQFRDRSFFVNDAPMMEMLQ